MIWVSDSFNIFQHVSGKLKSDAEVVLTAVKCNGGLAGTSSINTCLRKTVFEVLNGRSQRLRKAMAIIPHLGMGQDLWDQMHIIHLPDSSSSCLRFLSAISGFAIIYADGKLRACREAPKIGRVPSRPIPVRAMGMIVTVDGPHRPHIYL